MDLRLARLAGAPGSPTIVSAGVDTGGRPLLEPSSAITIELNPGEKRLYDRLRDQLVRRQPGHGTRLGDLTLLLPDLTVLLTRLLRDERVPLLSKTLALAGFAYVLSPIDFLPTLFFGPIGLVDDLVVVAAALSSILNHVHPDVVRSHWSGQGDALEAIQRVTSWVEAQTTQVLGDLLGRLFRGRS
jgi:uncharacterized membrane protein YkvA (DUF1232 family)